MADKDKLDKLDLYLKVGVLCGWTWAEYEKVPYEIIIKLSKKIDELNDG